MTEAVGASGNNYYLPDKNNTVKEQQTLANPDAFLKILVAQMKYQNPMEPQDSAAFISQLTQMASMEQTYNMSQSMDKMATEYEMARYFQLIGQQVSLVSEENIITGQVGGVAFQDNQPFFYFAGDPSGNQYQLEDVIGITGNANGNLLLPYLSLVDLQVTVMNEATEVSGIVDKVYLKNGSVFVSINGNEYNAQQIIGLQSVPKENTESAVSSTDNSSDAETIPAAESTGT